MNKQEAPRNIKDAYRFPGFTPLAMMERVPEGSSAHQETWAITLRRRKKKGDLLWLWENLSMLLRFEYKAGTRFGLWFLCHFSTILPTEGRLSRV
jgi:hypothetical protein